MDWVCEDGWIAPFTQAMHFGGSTLGTFLFGFVSDRFGRYPTFVISNIIITLGGLILPLCRDVYSFTVLRFLMGLSYPTFYFSIYLLCQIFNMLSTKPSF